MEATAEKNIVCLAGDDANFICRAKMMSREMKREVFRCLSIVSELDKAFDCLSEDDENVINELLQNWQGWYADDLKPANLAEQQEGIAERLTQQIEGILSGYLPDCQWDILCKLQARLPATER